MWCARTLALPSKPAILIVQSRRHLLMSRWRRPSKTRLKHDNTNRCHEMRSHMEKQQSLSTRRPAGVTALSIFFLAGAIICVIAVSSLLFPASFLEPIWRLNSRARTGFAAMRSWAIVLLLVVGVACAI